MSNVYYNYRGDNTAQSGPTPTPSSQQQLTPTKDPNTSLSPLSFPAVHQAIQLRSSTVVPASQSPPLGISSQPAWADQSLQQLSHTSQIAPQSTQHQPSLVPSPFLTVQTSRISSYHPMNGSRQPTVATRTVPQYDDPFCQITGKRFSDKASRPPTQASSALQHPQSSILDQYPQLRTTTASNVFDPSEFPSLGDGMPSQSSLQSNAATLLHNNALLDDSALPSSLDVSTHSVNGLVTYSDMYSMTGYGDGRAKAVDAVTGSSAAAEFNMQNEDFPALGGNPVAGGMLSSANLMEGAANGDLSLASPAAGRLAPGPPSASMDHVGMPSDSFDGASKDSVQLQLKAALGRGHVQLDQWNEGLLNGRGVRPGNVYQIGDAVHGNKSVQQFSRVKQQKEKKRLDVFQSPSKASNVSRSPTQGSGMTTTIISNSPRTIGEGLSPSAFGKMGTVGNDSCVPNGSNDGLHLGVLTGNGITLQQSGVSSSAGCLGETICDTEKPASLKRSVLPADQFGMRGLLKYVGAEADGTDANMLSIGVDLTMLGLDLNSPNPLHKTFANPWEGGQSILTGGDGPGPLQKDEEPDYKLPTCYYMQPPALKNSHFTKFRVETLFYVFYNMPRDVLQVLGAIELYNRKWMYHKDLKLWFHQNDMVEVPLVYERGAYVYFDIKSWEKRPFHDANKQFIQGLMTEDEVRSVRMPGQKPSGS